MRLPLDWRTRNLVGTTVGGSMYAAVDPFYDIRPEDAVRVGGGERGSREEPKEVA